MITQEEYEVLSTAYCENYFWISRDQNGLLCCYYGTQPPKKITTTWRPNTLRTRTATPPMYVAIRTKEFCSFIKWEDNEPYEIAKLLNEYNSRAPMTITHEQDNAVDVYKIALDLAVTQLAAVINKLIPDYLDNADIKELKSKYIRKAQKLLSEQEES